MLFSRMIGAQVQQQKIGKLDVGTFDGLVVLFTLNHSSGWRHMDGNLWGYLTVLVVGRKSRIVNQGGLKIRST